MSIIIPANTLAAGGSFDVDNSCRFETNTSLTKDIDSTNTSWTFSLWVKRTKLSATQYMISYGDSGVTNAIGFSAANLFQYYGEEEGYLIATAAALTDTSAWYHLVCKNASGTITMYVNGVAIPTTGGTTGSALSAGIFRVGAYQGGGLFFGGYMAEVCFIDSAALNPTSFGEFDEDSGIWKAIDVSGLTFGTDGFYLDYEASGNLGNDANGGTDLTENNIVATDQATDTCTNNFATLNPLNNYWAAATFSEGNSVYTSNNTGDYYGISPSTIAVSKGKWYFEAKTSTASGQDILGITSRNMTGRTTWLGSRSQEYGYYQDNGEIRSNAGGGGSDTSYGQTYTVNDIIGIYMDLDNNLMYVSDNGSLMNSGAGHTITAAASTDSGFYHFAVGDNSDSTQVWQCNFGGTSGFAISSAVADDNGFGAFEYSPNITGDSVAKKFYSLCTKNLAEFG